MFINSIREILEEAREDQQVTRQRAKEGKLYDDLVYFWENGEPLPESSGIASLSKHLKWKEGYVYCFTGYPGNGKSEFLNFLAIMWIQNSRGRKVALYSP